MSEVAISTQSFRQAVVSAVLKPGLGVEPLMTLATPVLTEIGLVKRTVFGISRRDGVIAPREHQVLCDLTSGKPIDSIVEILSDIPESLRRTPVLGSRYFSTIEIAQEFCTFCLTVPGLL